MREKTDLHAPRGYYLLNDKEKKCLLKDWKKNFDFIWTSLFGCSIKRACAVHEYMYRNAEPYNEAKKHADRVFLDNMVRLADDYTDSWFLRVTRKKLAMFYWYAVVLWGGPSFWKDKDEKCRIVKRLERKRNFYKHDVVRIVRLKKRPVSSSSTGKKVKEKTKKGKKK